MKSKSSFSLKALLIAIIVLIVSQIATAAGWYDVNWSYRRLITVPNPGSEVLSAFQVKITLNSSFDFSKAKTDGSDIRFTSDDGMSLIPFWIESWNPVGLEATIWIKVPSIPVTGVYVYLYYGNLSPTIPPPNPFETPPVGPFTRAAGNPIVLIGYPSASLLAENIVYDDFSTHYWLVFADYTAGGIGLAWSDTPTNPASWTYHGNIGAGNAPHIIKEGGLWYIFSCILPNIVYRTCTTINGTYSAPVTVLSPSSAWENYRVDEPYVFRRNDGKWIIAYMGDAGSTTEQVGYAIADNISGPYTKFAGNPCIPFGPPGSFDAGTVADPWVYEYYGVYYVGYTVSSTKNSPWQTAVATTTDWQTFTKLGVILPASGTALDAQNSFRGAVTRIGNTYVFPYTNGQYRMSIATQPVYFDPAGYINNPEAVFDFFDGFSGTALNIAKWSVANGSLSQATVSGGLLTLTAPSDAAYIRILATSSFGMNYMGETYSRHPNQGVQDKIAEYGFADATWNTVRIVDDFKLGTTYWQKQAKNASSEDIFLNMAQTANQNWHIFHTYRQSPNIAGFQIDDYPVEIVTTGNPPSQSVPTGNLPPFLMSYGAGNQIIVDWTRVRKWADSDPNTTIGAEQLQTPALNITYYKTDVTCYGYSDGAIDISVTGGSEPYTYLWTPGGQITQDITGIPAGSYSVLVTDSYLNAATSGVIVITQPAALLVNSAITSPIVCSGGNATVLISATGGTSPYTGVGSFPQSVGTTVYNVTDAQGCSANISVTINAPAPWYNNSWQYRREVTVTNPGGAALTDYQAMISLNSSFDFANAKGDGTDIRFTSNDGTTLIPFWLETWNPAGYQANIWIKVPTIPIGGTSVYAYYGNPNPTIDIPVPIEVPPTGPFTRAVGNPIVPSGATGTSLLAENIVYDGVTGHYWMCLANYSQSAISLCYSDNPTDPGAWIWSGNVITTFTQYYSGAPHLLKHMGTWYLFYADRPHIKVATASNVAGPYTIYLTPMLAPSGPAPAWDNFRVDEPYVFFRESDSKWVIVYMGDSGGAVEQVGYATADNILGPYTAYSGNPCIAFGVPGSFDAGTIADPWVYKYHEVYYIGYTVSPTNASPWQTACATTTDWLTFTKLGVIFPVAISGWDAVNSFRGAITRIGDTYVFSYTGDGYKMGIATQPVYMTPPTIINNVDAVFDFYDGFNETALDGSKWYFGHGNSSSASVGGGNLTLTHSSGDYPSLHSQTTFGMNYLVEIRARHPQQGTLNMVIETGFNQNFGDMVRLVDDFPPSIPNCTTTWNRQTKLSSQGGDPNWQAMAQTADQNWHVFKVFRQSPGTAGFQIDETPAETTSNSVPTSNLPVFLMSYTESATNHFIVDWIRVRKYAGVNPTTSVGGKQIQISVNGYVSYYNTVYTPMGNVTVNLPGSSLPPATTSTSPAGPLYKIGYFSFDNICPGTYNVVVSTSENAGGINVTDAAQTNYWSVFYGAIEKVRFLAGDVTGDNEVRSADASNILQYFLTQGNPTPAFASQWSFWKTEDMIDNNPGPEDYPTINVSGSNVTQNLYGLVTGDFNQSFVPGGMKAVSESLTLIYGETISVIPEMEFDLPLSVAMDMEVGAVSLILDFPSDLMEVNGVYLTDDPNTPVMHEVSGDELRIGWNSIEPASLLEGESLLTLKVKVIGSTGEEGIRFKLAADPLNELADGGYNVISNAVLSIDIVKTVTTGTGEISLSDRLTLANHPNPFTGKTTFTYSLPVDGKVTLEIYDIVGNKVKSLVDVTQSAGDYFLSLDEATLPPGVYTATIKLDSNGNLMTRTIKIISKQ